MTPRARPATAYCRACRGRKTPGHYLCETCWFTVPAPARRALTLRDAQAVDRLRALLNHINSGLPLADLEITP
ncbi:hypothetical protein [Streptomyces bacillaris]|uniref:hypothetical protein n=1 Tax=Streptomyces bacillaris TaxID=68179 RepID=UPI00363171B8